MFKKKKKKKKIYPENVTLSVTGQYLQCDPVPVLQAERLVPLPVGRSEQLTGREAHLDPLPVRRDLEVLGE